jgi:hypothetical protein
MESPLLMISSRKKKLTQWLKLNHQGNPLGSSAAIALKADGGSAGKPKTRYWNQAPPTTISNTAITAISTTGFIAINGRLSAGNLTARSALLKLVNILKSGMRF